MSLKKKSQDDIELMTAIARGSKPELGQLYLLHKEKVLALAYRILGQWNLAEDVTQETFLRVQRAAQTYRPDAEFTAWLYRIVVNLCLDEKRRQKRRAIYNSQITEMIKISNNHAKAEQKNNKKIIEVRKAIKRLNKRQRRVVVLHKIEGLSHTEISKQTGWSQSSIESLLVRAYRKLRKELVAQSEYKP